ncbi:MAG: class I SAM-dependent methyltransferase [Proteobacteria bacterium]|nr:class I SAM-dependent methyltransferase [Pseudomonadota bacterium]HQR02745.1 class I SAM-dependent methyltransferase [Rhodocyclaceae bacterium]
MRASALLHWQEPDGPRSTPWFSPAGHPPPKRVVIGDDTLKADIAYRLACEGTAILWRGDYHNARQLLQALARRVDRKGHQKSTTPREAFHLYRMAQAQRATMLNRVLVPVDSGYRIPLRRAPDVAAACTEAFGTTTEHAQPFAISLRELQGLIGAHEWRRKGVTIPALGARIHPHYGVFSPVRGEYVDLVARAPLPATLMNDNRAFDIGTGSGVLAALLVQRGIEKVVATDQEPRALACAADNLARLGMTNRVELLRADLFPPDRAALVICNPPWIPARPGSPLEHAIYDPESRMLRGFLAGLRNHLSPHGEGWLILSDLAEHLELRSRTTLLAMFAENGLQLIDRLDIRPRHARARDASDPLHMARTREITSLWRLGSA